MIQTDVGDYRGYGRDDVCGVEATSKTRLDDRHLDTLAVEMVEGHRRRHLEERQSDTLHCRAMCLDKFDHLLLRNLCAIDADALAEIVQVGRGEQTRVESRRLQHRGDDVRG